MNASIIQKTEQSPEKQQAVPKQSALESEIEFHIGMCLKVLGKKYRCLNVTPTYLTLCEMDCSRLRITYSSLNSIHQYLLEGEAEIIQDDPIVLDVREINEKFLDEFYSRREAINRVINEYGPDFFDLNGRKPKSCIIEILNEKKISRKPFYRLLLRYLQSGMSDYALVDKRWTRYIDQKTIQNEASGEIIKKSDMHIHFDWGIEYFKEKKGKASIMVAYLRMSWEFYCQSITVEGKSKRQLLPKNERPTYKQFLYYFHKHVSKKELEIIKTSQAEYRNNHRLLGGSSETGVHGCYDMLEMDACEAPLELINEHNQNIGKPIIYALVDVATRAVVAATASFENNSINGFMSCLCNLNEDKRALLAKHGITDFDPRAWLTGYKPRAIRMDNGADFRSNYVGEILKSFGIERILVSPGSGSLKGVVERSFKDFQDNIRPSTVNHGLISDTSGSNPHREATLNMYEFRTMLYRWVIFHNTSRNTGIDSSRDMILSEIPPIPCEVMDYQLKAKQPLRFPTGDEFRMKILSKGTANVNRYGLEFKKLIYFPKDNPKMLDMIEEMCLSEDKKLNILYDPLCVDNLFFLQNGHLIAIPLNEQSGRQSSYLGLTFAETEDLYENNKPTKKKALEITEQNRAAMLAANDETVEKARQNKYADTKNMRKNRAAEKQRINSENALSKRFDPEGDVQPESAAQTENINALPAPEKKSETSEPTKKPKLTLEEKIARIGSIANGYIKE